jgi:hypothetical protein
MANRIQKAKRRARQGFGKFKKPNPSCGDARVLAPTKNEDTPFTNGSFALSAQEPREAPLVSSFSISKSSLSNEEKNEIQAPEDPAALSDMTRC